MRAVDIICRKRDGAALDLEEIEFFVDGATAGSLPDYQVSALLMAILLRGMSDEETVWLTDAMARSGVRLDLSSIPGPKVDKHSTGGVGDKTSLVVAPLAAACGAVVPMISGRGLGHTGGTLDKLESIPGFRVDLSLEEFLGALRNVGFAIVGQTPTLAPADRKLYALRDVTGTVDSIPLITASIMSKKIAEGVGALVLDVKVGRGAFMKSLPRARALARSLVSIGNRCAIGTEALITSMDAPLGRAVGNAGGGGEPTEPLGGGGPADLEALSVALAARMLSRAGIASSSAAAEERVRAALGSGAGLAKLGDLIASQGGDVRVIDDLALLPSVPGRRVLAAPRPGYLVSLDAELIGRAAGALGAGRSRADAAVDPAVGLVVLAKPGARLEAADPIVELHYRDEATLGQAEALATAAIELGDNAPELPDLIREEVR
jgi:pyrimidine-nucleoside phosphorylase